MPMPVTFTPLEIAGVFVAKGGVARDNRGFFTETYSERVWRDHGFQETFVQDSMSLSAKGTLRGMHYQIEPYAMGKLVRAVTGAVFDVAVDLRGGSPTFGQWVGQELSAENGLALWVPVGFAHGFVALEDDTLVYYKSTCIHTPEAERSLSYKCSKLNIRWPIEPALITKKDAEAPGLDAAEHNFVY